MSKINIDLDSKVDNVLSRAKGMYNAPNEEFELFRRDIRGSLEKGWSEIDILLFMGRTEEMNPELSEDSALRSMARINARNKTHFGGHTKCKG